MNLADEKWETIKEFPNYMISSNGRILNKKTLKFVKPVIHKRDRQHVVNLWKNNKSKLFSLYRLLAIHFIPNPLNKPAVNHISGNRADFSLENLEWVTHSENSKHAYVTGLNNPGKGLTHNCCRLSENDIILLRRWYKSGFYDRSKLGKIFNVSKGYASKIASGKEGLYV